VNSRGRKPVEEEQKKAVRPEGADETFPRIRQPFLRAHTFWNAPSELPLVIRIPSTSFRWWLFTNVPFGDLYGQDELP